MHSPGTLRLLPCRCGGGVGGGGPGQGEGGPMHSESREHRQGHCLSVSPGNRDHWPGRWALQVAGDVCCQGAWGAPSRCPKERSNPPASYRGQETPMRSQAPIGLAGSCPPHQPPACALRSGLRAAGCGLWPGLALRAWRSRAFMPRPLSSPGASKKTSLLGKKEKNTCALH